MLKGRLPVTDLDEVIFAVRRPTELSRAEDALVESGVARAEVASARDAVAAIGAATEPASTPAQLRERLFASLAKGGRYGRFADRLSRLFDLSAADADALCARIEDPSAFGPFLVAGVDVIPVVTGPRLGGAIGVIARIQPGASFPEHVHRGEETMLLLDGGLREDGEGGHEAWRGDELLSADGSSHAFVALPGQPCIAASLIEGVAEFR